MQMMHRSVRFYEAVLTDRECLIDVRQDLSSGMLSSGLLVVHDARRSGEDDLSERTSREQLTDPVLERVNSDVEPW